MVGGTCDVSSALSGRYKYVTSTRIEKYCQTGFNDNSPLCGYRFSVTNYDSVVESTSYSKGDTSYSDATATSSSTYPSNGRSGSYWYVYKGVQ